MRQRGPTLRYDVNERPPLFIAAGLGFQNALFVISGAILLPILLRAADLITAGEAAFLISASLLTAGLSTAVQAIRVGAVGSGFMLFMGTSGAFFAATFDAVALAGIGFVAALALIAAPTELLIARFFRLFRNVFTPTVGGVVVMCVAITVVPLTIQQWNGVGTDKAGSLEYMAIGGVAVLVMVAMIVLAPPVIGFGRQSWGWQPAVSPPRSRVTGPSATARTPPSLAFRSANGRRRPFLPQAPHLPSWARS